MEGFEWNKQLRWQKVFIVSTVVLFESREELQVQEKTEGRQKAGTFPPSLYSGIRECLQETACLSMQDYCHIRKSRERLKLAGFYCCTQSVHGKANFLLCVQQ